MTQTKKGSLSEALFNTAVGFGINFIANLVILPHFGFNIRPTAAFHMGLIFTVISVVRGYVIRRLFNHPTFRACIEWADGQLRRFAWRRPQ